MYVHTTVTLQVPRFSLNVQPPVVTDQCAAQILKSSRKRFVFCKACFRGCEIGVFTFQKLLIVYQFNLFFAYQHGSRVRLLAHGAFFY